MNKFITSAVIAATIVSAMPVQAGMWKLLTGETYKEYAHRTNQERIEKNLTWQWTKDDWKAAAIGVALVAPLVAGAGAGGGAATCIGVDTGIKHVIDPTGVTKVDCIISGF